MPPPVATFLLTSETDAEAIIAHARRCRTNTLQLVDQVADEVYPRLRAALPGIKLVQVIHVAGEQSVAEAVAAAAHADALLLDSGQPHAAIKILGGTGRVHDWAVSRRIVEAAPVPGVPRRRAARGQCRRGDRDGAAVRGGRVHRRAPARRLFPRSREARGVRRRGRGRRLMHAVRDLVRRDPGASLRESGGVGLGEQSSTFSPGVLGSAVRQARSTSGGNGRLVKRRQAANG